MKQEKRKFICQKNNFDSMNSQSEYLVDLIYKKLKNYKAKKITLDEDNLKKFIFSLFNQ